jgi:S-adenosylmethionine uptake transporter
MASPSDLQGAMIGLAAMATFAFSDAVIKFLGGGYSPFQIIFFSCLMTFPLIAGLTIADPEQGNLRPRRPKLMLLRCFVALINSILGTFAFASLSLAQCYAIVFTMPIFIALLSVPVLGERIDLVRGIAVLAGLVGVVVALDPGTAALQWGHAAALGSAIFGAANYVIIRKTGTDERMVALILYPLILQMIVAALVLPLVYQPMPLRDLGLTALMAATSFVGYLLIIAAYRRAPGIVVGPMQYSQIIWAAIFDAVLFGEQMTSRMVLGTAVIILAGLAIVLQQDRTA